MKQKSLLSIERLGHDIALGDDVAVYVAWARSVRKCTT